MHNQANIYNTVWIFRFVAEAVVQVCQIWTYTLNIWGIFGAESQPHLTFSHLWLI